MFPLNAALLPGMPLPLRIFEERYRVMLGRVLDDPEPGFGVVLIAQGHEAGGGDVRHDVGTMARIVRVTAGEGAIDVVAIGGRRIRVSQWIPDDPYPRALVEELPPLTHTESLRPLLSTTETAVRRVLARAAEYRDVRRVSSMPLSEDPVSRAWQLAGIAPIAELDRLTLLGSGSLGDLLRRTLDLTLAAEPTITAAGSPDAMDAEIAELLRNEEG